jgi:hypothetical protein
MLNKKQYVKMYKFINSHNNPNKIRNYLKYIMKALEKYDYKIRITLDTIQFILKYKYNIKILYSNFDYDPYKCKIIYDKNQKIKYELNYYTKKDYWKQINYNFGSSKLKQSFYPDSKIFIFNYNNKSMGSYYFYSNYDKILNIKIILIRFNLLNLAKSFELTIQSKTYNINTSIYLHKIKYARIYRNSKIRNYYKYNKFITLFLDSNYRISFILL